MKSIRFSVVVVGGVSVLLATFGCQQPAPVDTSSSSLVELVAAGGSDVFSLTAESYASLDSGLPIGVFDSGIGGLTVLEKILTIDRYDNRTHAEGGDGRPDFEAESFIYLGDQANMPYGNYPAESKVDFLDELILKDALFLLGNRYWPSRSAAAPRNDKPPIKAVVIACNTATAYGLDDVERALKAWGVPVFLVGVVAAGADGAIEAIAPLEDPGAVAVLATIGTCSSGGYVREIERSAREAGLTPPPVIQQGSLGLASAIEGNPEFVSAGDADATYRGPAVGNPAAPIDENLIGVYGFNPRGVLGDPDDPASWRLSSVDSYIRYDTTSLMEAYRTSGWADPITTVVLGCTHFPYYADEIERALLRLRDYRTPEGDEPYRRLVAEDLVMVDPAELTAAQLYEALAERGLLVGGEPGPPADEFYISVPNGACPGVELRPDGRSFTYAYKYGRSVGALDLEYVRRVPMSRADLSVETLDNIRESMPAVWDRMLGFSEDSPRLEGVPEADRLRVDSLAGVH